MRYFFWVGLLTGLALGQVDRVDEDAKLVTFGGKTVNLGAGRPALNAMGAQTAGGIGVFPGTGVSVRFDRNGQVEEIVVQPPFAGSTKRGVTVGTRVGDLAQRDPRVPPQSVGRLQVQNIAYELQNGQVVAMIINGKAAAAPIGPGGAVLPSPQQPPLPPVGQNPNGPGQGVDLQEPTVIWDQVLQAQLAPNWVDAPVDTWPSQRGILMVRVAYRSGVSAVNQLIAGIPRDDTPDADLETPSNVIDRFIARGGRNRSWKWSALGSGPVRVQIIWFPRERDAERYVERVPHQELVAALGPANPGGSYPGTPNPSYPGTPNPSFPANPGATPAGTAVWSHQWTLERGEETWFIGPARTWDLNGTLVLRVAGGPRVRGILWKVGRDGDEQELPPGDHFLPVDFIDRAPTPRFSPGPNWRRLWVRGRGRGEAQVELRWFPDRTAGQNYCAGTPYGQPPVAGPPPLIAEPEPRRAPGYVTATFRGTVVDRLGRGVPGSDVVVQLAAEPNTIYGGGRTDAYGRFAMDICVPLHAPVCVRLPREAQESPPRAMAREREEMIWDAQLR